MVKQVVILVSRLNVQILKLTTNETYIYAGCVLVLYILPFVDQNIYKHFRTKWLTRPCFVLYRYIRL